MANIRAIKFFFFFFFLFTTKLIELANDRLSKRSRVVNEGPRGERSDLLKFYTL